MPWVKQLVSVYAEPILLIGATLAYALGLFHWFAENIGAFGA
ncbi:MAG: hypothetical protein UV82_C0010G0021 [Candidatus Magasanikbacteria bacterium GW2011_GWD2_43_18]|uniref:Uncharacterized protein n=1 Tax=Candidatus Magasanikbacteria bacterium GW2011_GWE2_42_7 TaxID=1619052 RepID=A0A0G1DLS4_9BACT|nr:MAG: hypothetical protein UV42_C0019G0010 [Candidatus Magasanikbacteria bacterium GW2011_GWE2_42_7]KKT04205.1 MAG: hypothetical protein UV82_C0010G0021 [Candidatus Magasanikbacteria bacterium GW2011_GWD2_43_18]KKT25899.1 MAG: hypothetical protein UW10_C0003G0060 [Candidatus Magasanikbacteria bacterium GW2011_GWA2_43_9]